MKSEHIKSIILSTLVAISLVLSYSLLSYQPAYDVMQNSNYDYVQNVSIGAKKQYKDVVVPTELIVHETNNHYLTTKQNNILPLYRALQKTEISSFSNITSKTSLENYQGITKGKNKVEIIFPTLIPIETLNKVLNIDSKRLQNVLFDRVIISLSTKQDDSTKIYFANESLNVLYEAIFDNSEVISAVEKVKNNYDHYIECSKFELDSGKFIYLPKKTVKLKTIEYLTSDIAIDKLKDAIFYDPSKVRKESSSSGDTFTDGTRLMTVSQLNRSLTFVNPTTVEDNSQSPSSLVERSFGFINQHGGWTDHYVLTSIQPDKSEVSFRFYVNNLPVYKNATISTKLGTDDVQTFKRPLYKFEYRMEKNESEVELMSGSQIMDVIKKNKTINDSLIKDISIGYETIFNSEKEKTMSQPYYNRAVELKPVWIIHYGDTYKKIDQDMLSRIGVNIVGLE